jgi:Holin of 3TMs, for gene-transfer release
VPILDQLFAGGLKDLFDSVVGQFHLSKEDQAKFQAAIDENKKEIELAQIELEVKLQDALSSETKAALDAYKAEQTGDDKYTKRWRPTFGYTVTFLIFWNYAIVPLFNRPPVILPDRLLEMFGALLLVAIGGRSFEKIFGNGSGK